ncbi:hypothetical protein EVAR_98574_1 [Eumeta japonica]|uniref:Uncharacterized protein n=1 Tax=Eumeta variegata TaxID=151549 RepID=A0A4C1YW86_EUMVA|nr:hypothetical protein EVAR_98574_1 [Eumeta japonica]
MSVGIFNKNRCPNRNAGRRTRGACPRKDKNEENRIRSHRKGTSLYATGLTKSFNDRDRELGVAEDGAPAVFCVPFRSPIYAQSHLTSAGGVVELLHRLFRSQKRHVAGAHGPADTHQNKTKIFSIISSIPSTHSSYVLILFTNQKTKPTRPIVAAGVADNAYGGLDKNANGSRPSRLTRAASCARGPSFDRRAARAGRVRTFSPRLKFRSRFGTQVDYSDCYIVCRCRPQVHSFDASLLRFEISAIRHHLKFVRSGRYWMRRQDEVLDGLQFEQPGQRLPVEEVDAVHLHGSGRSTAMREELEHSYPMKHRQPNLNDLSLFNEYVTGRTTGHRIPLRERQRAGLRGGASAAADFHVDTKVV